MYAVPSIWWTVSEKSLQSLHFGSCLQTWCLGLVLCCHYQSHCAVLQACFFLPLVGFLIVSHFLFLPAAHIMEGLGLPWCCLFLLNILCLLEAGSFISSSCRDIILMYSWMLLASLDLKLINPHPPSIHYSQSLRELDFWCFDVSGIYVLLWPVYYSNRLSDGW